ncbi:MAG TPA: DUF3810 domain-containing protein [Candidatus Faeciplasma gallinarum]|uniref:DUF3810 domain-containing protein n=1 Tax=Candidatus Faeciplasma gallinarum TaxID=2840799 RepID=A0A9D1EMW8_9FIRM|nr:DUF3810 domain-containing protein [Candidatus Faeciplasma gallinarum]
MNKLKLKKSDIVLIVIFVVAIAANVVARLSVSFSDFYVQKIYPIISTPFIFLSWLVSFSIGELMIAAGVAAVLIGLPVLIVFSIVKRKNKPLVKKVSKTCLRVVLWALAYVFATETFNCFIMYQCSTFSSRYFPETEHTEELLIETIGDVSVRLAELYNEFERGEDGYIVLDESYIEECKTAMKNISNEYSQLSGYYPNPKKIYSSFFMSQQGIIGLYIPFAFEATYNRDTQDISKPSTICHELSHLKGVIQEDEASFVAMVACFNSDSPAVRYSGYLDAFYYLYSDASELIGTEYEQALAEAIACVPSQVWDYDLYSYKADYWEENKDKEIIPTETVEAVSDALTEANLQFNDVEEGIMIYYRVTELLMDYCASGGYI